VANCDVRFSLTRKFCEQNGYVGTNGTDHALLYVVNSPFGRLCTFSNTGRHQVTQRSSFSSFIVVSENASELTHEEIVQSMSMDVGLRVQL
jgi:hypothetical protein